MEHRETIEDAYIDYVLLQGKHPNSVYAFCKSLGISEGEFYAVFPSFDAVDASIWEKLVSKSLEGVQGKETWKAFTAREKLLSFFFGYTEYIKSYRSYVTHSFSNVFRSRVPSAILTKAKERFFDFVQNVIQQGLESGEIKDRKLLTDRYKDGLWLQFLFITRFWIGDVSEQFEKTDEAIEKGVNVSFDLMARTPLDELFDYGKFLLRNGKFNFRKPF